MADTFETLVVVGSAIISLLVVTLLTIRQLSSETVREAFHDLRINILRLAPIVVGTTAALVATTTLLFQSAIDAPPPREVSLAERVAELQFAVSHSQDQLKDLRTLLERPIPPGAGVEPNAIRSLEARLAKTEGSVEKVEGLILTDPERLLTVPILVREVQSLRTEVSGLRDQMVLQSETLRESVQEAQSQARWILGTLGLGLLALVIPIVRSAVSGRSSTSA